MHSLSRPTSRQTSSRGVSTSRHSGRRLCPSCPSSQRLSPAGFLPTSVPPKTSSGHMFSNLMLFQPILWGPPTGPVQTRSLHPHGIRPPAAETSPSGEGRGSVHGVTKTHLRPRSLSTQVTFTVTGTTRGHLPREPQSHPGFQPRSHTRPYSWPDTGQHMLALVLGSLCSLLLSRD